jgi:hypothetical protein
MNHTTISDELVAAPKKIWARLEPTDECRRATSFLLEVANTHPETRQSGGQLSQSASKFLRVKDNGLITIGADYLVVSIEPTERLMEFMAAHGARKHERAEGQDL